MAKKEDASKVEKIAKILGIMEDRGKSKDWLLEQLKRQNSDMKISPTQNSYEILSSCTDKTISKIYRIIAEDEEIPIEDIKMLSKTLHWFFTDIVGSSNPLIPVKNQARMINLLNALIRRTDTFRDRDKNSTFIQSTGDGMAIGFADNPEKPLILAIELHKLLYKYNKSQKEKNRLHIRIGIDSGPVYFIQDVDGKETVWGSGIIMAKRVMDLCRTDQIFASRRIGDDISKLSPQYRDMMHPIGDYSIKHGEQLLIYNIYGKGFGNKIAPKKSKVRKEKNGDDLTLDKPSFEFNRVEIWLDILDPKTMMTHHTWIWDVRNISKEPLKRVFYSIGGDTPRDFRDLNVSIKDEDGNSLENITLDSNKNHEKKFIVELKKPVRKNQKGRILKLEYDWEEPYRVFEYVFSARCKKFKYVFTAPKKLQIKNRVLEVAKDLGLKKHATPPPKINYENNKTKVTWENDKKQKIGRLDTFEFQW